MKRSILTFLAVGALGQLIAGCGGFTELDFTFRSAPADNTALVSFTQIQLKDGIAVGVVAQPLDHGKVMDSSTEVLLQSKNPGVLGVGPGEPTDAEKSRDEENWTFVIFGVAPGQTEVQVFIDGTLEAHIPATVGAQ